MDGGYFPVLADSNDIDQEDDERERYVWIRLTPERRMAIQVAEIEFREPNSWPDAKRIQVHEILCDLLVDIGKSK